MSSCDWTDDSSRRAIIGALLSHVSAWQDLSARLDLLHIIARAQDVAVFRGLLPLLISAATSEKDWLLQQNLDKRTSYLNLLFGCLDAKSVSVLQEDDATGWKFVKSLLEPTDGAYLLGLRANCRLFIRPSCRPADSNGSWCIPSPFFVTQGRVHSRHFAVS